MGNNMLTQDNLLNLAFDDKFREGFPEFQNYFTALDNLGGRNCKSCKKNRQRLIVRDMYNKIVQEKKTEKASSYIAGMQIIPTVPVTKFSNNTNYSKMPISLEQFIPCLLFAEVKEVLYLKLGEKMGAVLTAIETHGVYSDKVKEEAELIYPEIFKDEVFSDFNEEAKKLDIINKVRSVASQLKVRVLNLDVDIESKINRFILGKNIISIQKDGDLVLITYR
jgi:hypothetical protein